MQGVPALGLGRLALQQSRQNARPRAITTHRGAARVAKGLAIEAEQVRFEPGRARHVVVLAHNVVVEAVSRRGVRVQEHAV